MPRTKFSLHKCKPHVNKKDDSCVEVLDSWDAAIKKAKRKIAGLRQAIKTFKESKRAGEPWPGAANTQIGHHQ